MIQPDIFSRTARRRFRDRFFKSKHEDRWISDFIKTEFSDRIAVADRAFDRVLIIGNDGVDWRQEMVSGRAVPCVADPGFRGAHSAAGVQCDEDRLPFADGCFDLVLVPGGLDSVNDLPGALVLIRRILKPGGLFLGAMAGAGGLATLRSLIAQTGAADHPVARHHPQIDVRAAGDLLTRAGFARPVAESHTITARYSDFFRLIADLRANAMTNALIQRKMLRRDQLADMAARFSAAATPKTDETFALIFMTGWAPAPPASKAP